MQANAFLYDIDENERQFYYSSNSDTIITIVQYGSINYITTNGLDYTYCEYGKVFISNDYIYFIRPHRLPYRTVKPITTLYNIVLKKDHITVFPDPATEHVWITLDESYKNQLINWTTCSASGKQTFRFTNTGNELYINIHEFRPGLHFINAMTENGKIIYGKLIVVI